MSSVKFTAHSLCLLAITGLGACATTADKGGEDTGVAAYQAAIDQVTAPATPEQIAIAERSDPLKRASFWGEELRKSPGSLEITVRYMQALRTIGSHERVLEVASQTFPLHPERHEILLEVGRSLMAQNKIEDAARAFIRASDYAPQDVAAPLAALGVAFDRLERHDDAQEVYREALMREPNRVSTLSNYGLSLALTEQLAEAEIQLRKAASLPEANAKVRQNLALVLGLQGKFDEMIAVDPTAPQRTIEANRDTLRDMMVPARTYDVLADPAPAASEPMPSVPEDAVAEDAMSEPAPQQTTALDGGNDTDIVLRPKLRGSQGG